ncbi:MAG: peptidylprolyl isomerase [Anaeroplasmataceae bacterium]|nr:peptidylprolyl isomerase [Anaeroplasmataceae bacterium]
MNYQEFMSNDNPHVLLEVEGYGKIKLELFPNVAPITVKNFLKLVETGFYNGLTFHRVIEGFMIQGGDPLGNGTGGSKDKIKGEFAKNGVNNPLLHSRGVISMARSMFPDSASSQFFIMHKDAPHLDGSYAAFGVVTEGIEVVDKIASVDVNYHDMPLKPVVIKKAEVI